MAKNPYEQSIFDIQPAAKPQGPVECLGMTFDNDQKRRDYFLDKLREKLKDPEFRKIEGFPIGSDEDILALSDPPHRLPEPVHCRFHQALRQALRPEQATQPGPFAVDVSEGKTDPVYKAHSYHTKVPHLAIIPSILHYTEPGDFVLDGFCGSGMTGVAAQCCGSAPKDYRIKIDEDFEKQGIEKPRWGDRRVILNDLNSKFYRIQLQHPLMFEFANGRFGVEKEINRCTKLFTLTGELKAVSNIRFGAGFYVPDCAGDVVFLDEALDQETKSVKDAFACPHCGSQLTKNNVERVFETKPDPADGKPWKRVKYLPSRISYVVGRQRYEKQPDVHDLQVLSRISELPLPPEIPTTRFPIEQMYHGSRLAPKGFTHIHHFFLPRSAHALAVLWRKTQTYPDPRLRHVLLFFVEQTVLGMTLMNRHHVIGRANVNQWLTGVYYIPSIHEETAYWRILEGKLAGLKSVQTEYSAVAHLR